MTDVNNHEPKFTSGSFSANIPEEQHFGTSVTSVSATDEDLGDNARREYSIVEEDSHFFMDSIFTSGQGVVKVNKVCKDYLSIVNLYVTCNSIFLQNASWCLV